MADRGISGGLAELRAAQAGCTSQMVAVGVFSLTVNLLALTGPLYMLQVYDRVLASRSEPTLVALSGLVVMLFVAMGLLDALRGRIVARVAARFQSRLDARVIAVAQQRLLLAPDDPAARLAGDDLGGVCRLRQVCRICGTNPGPSGILACYESRSSLSPLPGDWRTSALPESPAPSAGSLLPRPQQGWPIFGRLSSILIWLVPILIKMIYACNIKS